MTGFLFRLWQQHFAKLQRQLHPPRSVRLCGGCARYSSSGSQSASLVSSSSVRSHLHEAGGFTAGSYSLGSVNYTSSGSGSVEPKGDASIYCETMRVSN